MHVFLDMAEENEQTQNSSDNTQQNESSSPQPQESAVLKLSVLFKSNMLDAAAWCIRLYAHWALTPDVTFV